MIEYPKIETLFERDGNFVVTDTIKDPRYAMLANCKWVFTEKIDGTNIRIIYSNGEFVIKGRTDNADIPKELHSTITNMLVKRKHLFDSMFANKTVTIYGEGYGAKIQKGGDYSPQQKFIAFDVMIENTWCEYDTFKSICDTLEIDRVPELNIIQTIKQAVEYVKRGFRSNIGTAMAEGVVGKLQYNLYDNRGKRIVIKLKTKDFKHK